MHSSPLDDDSVGVYLTAREQGGLWFRVVQRDTDTSTQESIILTGVLTMQQWHHVAATYDQDTGLAQVFVDGESEEQSYIYSELVNKAPKKSGLDRERVYNAMI